MRKTDTCSRRKPSETRVGQCGAGIDGCCGINRGIITTAGVPRIPFLSLSLPQTIHITRPRTVKVRLYSLRHSEDVLNGEGVKAVVEGEERDDVPAEPLDVDPLHLMLRHVLAALQKEERGTWVGIIADSIMDEMEHGRVCLMMIHVFRVLGFRV